MTEDIGSCALDHWYGDSGSCHRNWIPNLPYEMFGVTRKFEVLQLKECRSAEDLLRRTTTSNFYEPNVESILTHCPSRFLWVPTGFDCPSFYISLLGP